MVEVALAKGGAKPETMTAALAEATNDKEKTTIAELVKKAGAVPPLEIDAATLQTYVGRYKNEQGVEISLTSKDGKLFVTPPNQRPLLLMTIDKVNFRPTAFEGLMITLNTESGRMVSLSVKQGANTTAYKRVEESQPK